MKIAFVCPRFGADLAGGAETLIEALAAHIADEEGYEVEVLTTCARDHFGWENYYPPGEKVSGKITVRRFLVNQERDTNSFLRIQSRIMQGIEVSRDEEERWASESVNSSRMYSYIAQNSKDYDCFIFIPYLFGTTIMGSRICPEKSFLIPALHDEPYAYIKLFRDMFRSFRGIMFNTEPEMSLAKRLYGLDESRISIVSMGFEKRDGEDGERFRKRYNISGNFCLYVGRREGGKNTPLLLNYFDYYRQRNKKRLRLVLLGSGEVEIPEDCADEIVDLGYLSHRDKYDAHPAAAFLCQPSLNESLSITLMESWLAEVPVLVHGGCAVTKDHCLKSNGGLFFEDYFEFEECVNLLLDNAELRRRMGGSGRRYVEENYNWPLVIKRFKEALAR